MRENSKRQHPASLHASGEDYLEAILILHMKKGTVRSVDVARHLGVSKPSVCHAVALLKDGGFLTMDEDFSLAIQVKGLGQDIDLKIGWRDFQIGGKVLYGGALIHAGHGVEVDGK